MIIRYLSPNSRQMNFLGIWFVYSMEGNDVCKIYLMAAVAADMLAGGSLGIAPFPGRLAPDASVQAGRDYRECVFPFHKSVIHAPGQSSWRIKQGPSPKVPSVSIV